MRVLTGARLAVLSLPLLGACDAVFGYHASGDGMVPERDARTDRGLLDIPRPVDRPALDASMYQELPAPDKAVSPEKAISPDMAFADMAFPDTGAPDTAPPDKGAPDTAPPKPDASVNPPVCGWARGYGAADEDRIYAVAADANGNVYLTGRFAQTVTFGTSLASAGNADIFLVSLDPAGNVRWAKSFGSAGDDLGLALAVDGTNNVYLTGTFQGSVSFGGIALTAQSADIVLASFDSAGNPRWSKRFGGQSVDQGYALAVDSSGNVFLTGEYRDTVDFGGGTLTAKAQVYQELYLASFAGDGTYRWAKSFGTADGELGVALAVDAAGNVGITGVSWAAGLDLGGGPIAYVGQDDVFLASFTNGGAHRWSKGFGSVGEEQPMGLAADGSGNLYMTGFFTKPLTFGGPTLSASNKDGFVASFDSLGYHRWSQRMGGSNADYVQNVAVGAAGNILVAGVFTAAADVFGKTLTSAGGYDLFLASLSSSGVLGWAMGLGATNSEILGGLALDGAGNVFLGGYFYGSTVLGGVSLQGTNMKATDAFVVKLAP